MKNKRSIRILAALMALLLVLCACTPTEPTNGNGTTTENTSPLDPNCPHADSNDDGTCDNCGGNVMVTLDFYAFNDLHGVFNDTASNPGVDELTTYLKNAYADDTAYEIVLSSGDMWQGSVESSSNKGQLMTDWMNELGFVSMTLGNHEYDWGSQTIAENAQNAYFPFLGINVVDSNTREPYCQSSVTVERGGVKIGIIGAIGDCLSSISGEFTDGLEFIVGDELTELVKAEAQKLRQDGCDLIVYSLHEGGDGSTVTSYYDETLSDGYVDIVFEGHTHSSYVVQDSYGVYHVQAGGYNSGLGYVRVGYNTVTGSHQVKEAETLKQSVYADSKLADDPIVETLFGKFFPDEDPYTSVIGTNLTERSSTEIVELVAQLYLEKGKEVWGDKYEIVLAGGFLKCRTPYKLSAGNVTYSQLYSLLPFDNDLVLCRVTGRQLKQIFINSRNENYHCAYDKTLVVDENTSYYVVTDTYTSFYKYNMLEEVDRIEDYYARDLLKDYIAAGNWYGEVEKVTIQQALQYGQMLSVNETTEKTFRVTGTITSITGTQYGNLYIQDEYGDSIFVYGLYDQNGKRYDAMDNPPKVGDTITIIGKIKRYGSASTGGTIEFINATLDG